MKQIVNAHIATGQSITPIPDHSFANQSQEGSVSEGIEAWYEGNAKVISAIDSHAHVFIKGLPLAPVRRHAPDYDAPLDTYVAHLQENGISHAVLVQPSFLGTDNSFIEDVLTRYPLRFRGVAMVETSITDAELTNMRTKGFVGIRLNLVGLPIPPFRQPEWRNLLSRVNALGWHVEVHRQAVDIPDIVNELLGQGCQVVVDHFGRPDPATGINDPGFQALLRFADSGQVWVKLSAAYRTAAHADSAQFGRQAACLLLDAYTPQRLVWGSDWPHTQHREIVDYQAARRALDDWIQVPEIRHTILVELAKQLFRL